MGPKLAVCHLHAAEHYAMTQYGMMLFSVYAALSALFLSSLKQDLCVDIRHHGLRMLDVLEKPLYHLLYVLENSIIFFLRTN